jgi:hypothetical protein
MTLNLSSPHHTEETNASYHNPRDYFFAGQRRHSTCMQDIPYLSTKIPRKGPDTPPEPISLASVGLLSHAF